MSLRDSGPSATVATWGSRSSSPSVRWSIGASTRSSSRAVTTSKEPPRLEAAADERQQPDAHLVRPVEVFEDQDRRLPVRHVPEEQAHPLEELQVVGRRRRLAIPGPEFGQKTPQLAPHGQRQGRRAMSGPPAPVRSAARPPRGRTAGSARSRGSARSAREPPTVWTSAASSATSRVLPTPASPTMATTRPRPPTASASAARNRAISWSRPMRGVSVASVRGSRRRVARGGEPPEVSRLGGHRDDGSPAEDLLVELLGLLLRLDSKLALQDSHAELVLLEGRPAAAELGVEAHERAVHRLLERVEGDQPQRRLEGAPPALPRRAERRAARRAPRGPARAAAPARPSATPRTSVPRKAKPVQEVTPIEADGLRERLRRPPASPAARRSRVDVDRVRVQGDGRRRSRSRHGGSAPAPGPGGGRRGSRRRRLRAWGCERSPQSSAASLSREWGSPRRQREIGEQRLGSSGSGAARGGRPRAEPGSRPGA